MKKELHVKNFLVYDVTSSYTRKSDYRLYIGYYETPWLCIADIVQISMELHFKPDLVT